MPQLSVERRLETRWRGEVEEAGALAQRSGGRLAIISATPTGLEIEMDVTSAFFDRGEVRVAAARHDIALLRPAATWPAEPVLAIHTAPEGVWHPNIAPAADERRGLRYGMQGAIWYSHAGPEMRLSQIITGLYNLLGYRHGAFAAAGEHLNPECLPWAQAQLAAGGFPLERRPLVEVDHEQLDR